MDKVHKAIQVAAIVLSTLAPAMLIAGYSYHLGTVLTFNVDSSLLPRSLGDLLGESFYMAVLFYGKVVKFLWPLIFITLGLGLFFYVLLYIVPRMQEKGHKFAILEEDFSKENQGPRVLGITCWHWVCLGEAIRDVSSWLLMPVWIFAVLGLGALKPFMIAQGEALKQIEAFNTHGCAQTSNPSDKFTCTKLVETVNGVETALVEGVLITATDDKIGVYTGTESEIWMLNDNRKVVRTFIK